MGSHVKSSNKASKPGKDADTDDPAKVPKPDLEHCKVVVTHEPVEVSEPLPTSGVEADEELAKVPGPDSTSAIVTNEPMMVPEPETTSAAAKVPEPGPRPASAVVAEVKATDPLDISVAVQEVGLPSLPFLVESDAGVQEDQGNSEEVPVEIPIDDGGSRSAIMVHHQVRDFNL